MWRRFVLYAFSLSVSVAGIKAQEMSPGQSIDSAVRLMDDGLYDESKALLESVLAVDADNYRASYEMAFLHYLQKDYKAAAKRLKKLTESPDVEDLAYQMLGNAYDMMGNRKKAENTYRRGLEKFPGSGKLYLELGNVAYNNGEYLPALSYFEQGIAAEPSFASNYYNAASVFLNSSELVWGMFYGEIFMNMERGSGRTASMSKYLYDAYKKGIVVRRNADSDERSLHVRFSGMDKIGMTPDGLIVLPFGPGIYEPLLEMTFPEDTDSVDMASLNRMRCDFVAKYFEVTRDLKGKVAGIPDTDNMLMDYQRRVADAGHMEAYNYWILMEGAPDAGRSWIDAHGDEWEAFLDWFRENPMQVDEAHRFHRNMYEHVRFEE